MEYENKEKCKNCGGKCCKKSGCDYFVSDFESLTKEYLYNVLLTGNVSIVAAVTFDKLRDGRTVCTPYLYLRARNVDREVIDLFSFKKQCSKLTETGCMYDINERPGGGVNLIPYENICTPLVNPVEELKKWEPYQNLLSKLVKRICGMSVDERFKRDVEEVFLTILNNDYDGIDEREIIDMLSCVNTLIECYPEEFKKARARSNEHVLKRK